MLKYYFLFLFATLTSFQALSLEAFDLFKGQVNQFWYHRLIDDCSNQKTEEASILKPEEVKAYLGKNMNCSNQSKLTAELIRNSNESKEILFFNSLVQENAKQNECRVDFWQSLNKQNKVSENDMIRSNKELISEFPNLASDLKKTKAQVVEEKSEAKRRESARSAQEKIIDDMISKAQQIAQKTLELKSYGQASRVYSVDPKNSTKEKVFKLQLEIENLENSLPLSFSENVKNYFKIQILNPFLESQKTGKQPNLTELKAKALSDSSYSFQKQVIEREINQSFSDQKDLASIKGQYNDQHNFKTSTFDAGNAQKLLYNDPNSSLFKPIACSLEAKYGKGAEVSNTANSLIVGGVTLIVGGAEIAVARLANLGIVSQRGLRGFQIISAVTKGSMSSLQVAKTVMETCFGNNYHIQNENYCQRTDLTSAQSIEHFVNKDIENAECVLALGTAAISGASAFNSAVKARKIAKQLAELESEMKGTFSKAFDTINLNTSLKTDRRKQIKDELAKSLKFFSKVSSPNPKLIQALSQDDPEALFSMLKEINDQKVGTSWLEKVKRWLASKSLNQKERNELEVCLTGGISGSSNDKSVQNEKVLEKVMFFGQFLWKPSKPKPKTCPI